MPRKGFRLPKKPVYGSDMIYFDYKPLPGTYGWDNSQQAIEAFGKGFSDAPPVAVTPPPGSLRTREWFRWGQEYVMASNGLLGWFLDNEPPRKGRRVTLPDW